MKKLLYISIASLMTLFGSCGMDPKMPEHVQEGEGRIALSLNAIGGFDEIESSTKAAGVDVNNFNVRVSGTSLKGIKYDSVWTKYSDMPSVITIAAGDYNIEAYNGEQQVGFDVPYYYGSKAFSVGIQEVTDASVVCQLACVKASVEFTPLFMQNITDGTAILHHNNIFLEFTPTTEGHGYINTPNDGILLLTIRGKFTEDLTQEVERTYQIKNVESKQWHKIKLSINTEAGLITDKLINIDLTVDEKDTNISIPGGNDVIDNNGDDGDWGNNGGQEPNPDPSAPTIVGTSYNGNAFNVDEPVIVLGAMSDLGATIMNITLGASNGGIQNLFLTMSSTDEVMQSIFAGLTPEGSPWDLANPSTMSTDSQDMLTSLGILDANDPIKDKKEYLFSIGGFMSMLTAPNTGSFDHTFQITVVDGAGNRVTKNLVIRRSL
ncbi:MAG: DUF4493 domain-containing protein [Marinifilaceae bacterium]